MTSSHVSEIMHTRGEVKKHQPVVIYCETEIATNLNENVENSENPN